MRKLVSVLLAAACLGVTCAAPVQTFVEAPGPLGPLKGTKLAPPAGLAPVGLIIPGSGPTDRDGNGNASLRSQTYRFLAEGLVAEGIATIRIDKRGMYGSVAAVKDGNAVTIADYADDVHAWAARSGASCLWILGHSEGGLVALAAAQRRTGICGLILIASPGRRLGDIMREQLGGDPHVLAHADPIITALERGHHVDVAAMSPDMQGLFRPEVQDFLIDALSYDPAKLIGALDMPVLILQGGRDLQVSEKDAHRLKAAAPKAELVLLPQANHVLKTVASDDRAANFATYSDPSLPLADGVVAAIADFIKRHAVPSLDRAP